MAFRSATSPAKSSPTSISIASTIGRLKRYVDDFALVHDDAGVLAEWHSHINRYLEGCHRMAACATLGALRVADCAGACARAIADGLGLMAGKIFINYRRDDERSTAARVRDRLAGVFGGSNVFMDVDNLMAGQRFDKELEKALAETDVFLAVIGPRWMELFAERQTQGGRDYVREEIAGALKRGIVVIPVLIERAPLPPSESLPDDIRELILHQKHVVTHEQFGRDLTGLVEAIRFSRRPAKGQAMPNVPWGWISATAASVVAVGWVGAYQLGVPVWWPFGRLPEPQLEVTQKQLDDAAMKRALVDEAKKQAEFAAAQKKAKTDADASLVESKRLAMLQQQQEEASRRADVDANRPGSVFRDCNNGCPEIVVVPAGTFILGAGSGQRRTTIPLPFGVGKFEVTFAEWDACVAGGGCSSNKRPSDQGWGKGKRPVINVSWVDAKEYVAWLSRKTGKTYRLLSEVEWEYSARAGSSTTYSWGDPVGQGSANCSGCGSQWDNKQTAPVGSFKSNDFGLHDMHGNVREWCEDADGSWSRVVRGGSWNDNPYDLRSTNRYSEPPGYRDSLIGFRIARTL